MHGRFMGILMDFVNVLMRIHQWNWCFCATRIELLIFIGSALMILSWASGSFTNCCIFQAHQFPHLGYHCQHCRLNVGHSIMVWLSSKEVTIHATPQMRLIQVVSCCNSPRYTLHGLSNKTTLANIGQLWFIPGIYMFFRRAWNLYRGFWNVL